MQVSLMQTCNTRIDKQVNAVCVTQKFHIHVLAITHLQQGWMSNQICSDMTLFLSYNFPKCKSHKNTNTALQQKQLHGLYMMPKITVWAVS